MITHKTGTREQWLAARLALLEAEKELTRKSDELTRRRQALPWVRVDKEYRFETDEGSASLADLFRGHWQLLVYHFMFGPDSTARCPTCSTIADGFNGIAVHLANHGYGTLHPDTPGGTAPTVAVFPSCPRERFRNPCRRGPDLPRRIGEGEPELALIRLHDGQCEVCVDNVYTYM